MTGCYGAATTLWRWRKQLVVVLTPIILLPLPLAAATQAAKGAYILLLMGMFWCTEVIPLPVTALLPIVIVPALGIASTAQVVNNYMKDLIVMILGSFVVSLAVERCNLHRRIALKILLLVGTKPAWLMLGFMLPSWLLSMCMCNTATVTAMLPVLEAVIKQLHLAQKQGTTRTVAADSDGCSIAPEKHHELRPLSTDGCHVDISGDDTGSSDVICANDDVTGVLSSNGDVGGISVVGIVNGSPRSSEQESPPDGAGDLSTLAKGLTLSISYAASVGGVATLTGAMPNMIMKDHADVLYQQHGMESPVNFATWFLYGLPISVVMFVSTWLWLVTFHLGPRSFNFCKNTKDSHSQHSAVRYIISKEYKALGPIRFSEVMVGLLWLTLLLLWFFRAPGFMAGWGVFFKPGYMGKSVPAVLVAAVLFVIPSGASSGLVSRRQTPATCCGQNEQSSPLRPTAPSAGHHGNERSPPEVLMDWQMMSKRLPWGMLLLTGGGFAVAEATMKSGFAWWLGDQLSVLSALPDWLTLTLLCLGVSLLTEFVSNPAAASLLMPVVAPMAEAMGRSPLFLMLPVAVTTGFAFMLPVGSPPNSVAFSFGRVKVIDMIKSGSLLNAVGVIVVTMATLVCGRVYFDLDQLPWAPNSTMTADIHGSMPSGH